MAELRATRYDLRQQTQKVSGSQESLITVKEKSQQCLKKKKKDEFPQYIYQSFDSLFLRTTVCLPNRHISASLARQEHCRDIKYSKRRTSDLRALS